MTKIVRGGQSGALDHIDSAQSAFRTQIAALTDAVRQLSGSAEIGPGAVTNDPLNAPYVLYVNPYTGSDKFVGGNYSTEGDALQRIELQRLECGYTEARPFRTINRAIIEAGIITAKSYYESPLTNNDLVSIVLMPGAQTVLNGPGTASVSEWAADKTPTNDELEAFNPETVGGILLPRGVSLCGLDLRKTIIRPNTVPAVADEASDASNRRSIFKVTGTGYYFGFTFMDKAGSTASHHLLHCFEFASQSELDAFYTKIRQAFGGTNNTGGLDNDLAVTRSAEYEIVGPQPSGGSQTINTDTTLSASPYIFNCSIRSNYGLGGVYADGAKTSGFRSLVIAQFTGVSLQRDLSCWQKYDSGASPKWGSTFSNYADYISTDPDNVRMHPLRRSFHIRAVNDAVIQEVSVFAIGQGIHHWTQSGGEITITNSNSNFGGCAAVSEGYKTAVFNADKNWVVNRIRVANNLSGLSNNIQKIYLGTISSVTSSSITLTTALGESATVTGIPDLLARDGYTLRSGSYIWVENPLGRDWRSTLTSSAWSSSTPAQINISAALTNEDSEAVGTTGGVSDAVGKRVYVRRLVDTRTPDQRRFSLKLNTTDLVVRTPVRDYVLQVTTGGGTINSAISTSSVLQVGNVTKTPAASGVSASAELTLRRGNSSESWTTGTLYKPGNTVKHNDKHYTCITENSDASFDAAKWQESYVHMATDYNPEDFYKGEAPILVFDNDTSGSESSTTLGYTLSTVWTTDTVIQAQYRSASDYKGLHLFLTALGFSSSQAHTILVPKAEASRDRDPSSSSDMGGYVPSGAASALDNWPVEFRRPSVIRLFGHAWEWTGYLNYTKAIPAYQKDLSPQNKFTYYFTNVDGGRVYATGFNEEGFQVTPRGLEDIVTGATLSVEDLGASDINLEFPTSYTSLTAGTLTVSTQFNLNGNVTLGSSAQTALKATTTQGGLGEMASISELANASQVTTDSALEAANPRFVTPEGLEYWRVQRALISQKTGTTNLYIVPDNAVNGGTYNFDGTSYTLTMDPSRSQSQLSGNEAPNTPTRAVKFSVAVTYANADLGSQETANYYLANGCYWTAVSFNHIANVYGAYSLFPDSNQVSSGYNSGGSPTTGVKSIYDNYSIPTFGATFYGAFSSFYGTSYIIASSAYLAFNQGGSINGIAFVGMDKMIADSTNWPDSLFVGGASYRSTSGNVVAYFANQWYAANGGSSTLYHYYQSPRIYLTNGKNLTVRNVISGPGLPGRGGRGSGVDSSLVDVTAGNVALSGIYLLGNVSVSPSDLSLITSLAKTNTTGCQHLQALVSGYQSDNGLVSVDFPYVYGTNPTATSNIYNYDPNCIHILTNGGDYGTAANKSSATHSSRGAAFRTIIGVLAPGTKLSTGEYTSYRTQGVPSGGHHGFAGVFGCAIDYESSDSGVDYSPVSVSYSNTIDTERLPADVTYLFQQAVSGTGITANLSTTAANAANADTTTDNQTGGIYHAYSTSAIVDNVLNLKSYTWRRGVNVNSGGRNGSTFYG